MISFDTVSKFEQIISDYFGAPYGVATDSCTHSIELSLRYDNIQRVGCPRHTYLSVPMTFSKLDIDWTFNDDKWNTYYYLDHTRIIDAAVLWQSDSYISGSLMCLSFQFKKHLPIGRGGMILTDDFNAYTALKEMSYDGRSPNIPWAEQDIKRMGYHYYMTPESAERGIQLFDTVKDIQSKNWLYKDYPDLSTMTVFN